MIEKQPTMVTLLQKITSFPRSVFRDMLSVALFFVVCAAWFTGFYFFVEFVHLTVWHWLIIGSVIINVFIVCGLILGALCDQEQQQRIVADVGAVLFTAFCGGLALMAVKYIPALFRLLSE